MSREIKFRAWVENEHVQSSVYPFMNYKIVFSGGLVNDIFATSGTQPINTLHNKITYMQYTGLKDKNGVEIYEGDVLSIPIGIRTENFLHVIKWEKETASFILEEVEAGKMTWYFDDLPYETGEVIGNIYEHPHLLEVAQ